MYGGAVITHGRACSGHGARSSARADECPPTFGAGRVCAAPGCETLLSSYNPGSVCCLHSKGWTAERPAVRRPRRVDERPELAGTCQNPGCGTAFVTTNPARKFCSDRCRMQAYQLRLASQSSSHATV
jgi:hypothetical protein